MAFEVNLVIKDTSHNPAVTSTIKLSENRKDGKANHFTRFGLPDKSTLLVSRQGIYIPKDLNGKAKATKKAK